MESENVVPVGLDALRHFTGASIFGQLATVAQGVVRYLHMLTVPPLPVPTDAHRPGDG